MWGQPDPTPLWGEPDPTPMPRHRSVTFNTMVTIVPPPRVAVPRSMAGWEARNGKGRTPRTDNSSFDKDAAADDRHAVFSSGSAGSSKITPVKRRAKTPRGPSLPADEEESSTGGLDEAAVVVDQSHSNARPTSGKRRAKTPRAPPQPIDTEDETAADRPDGASEAPSTIMQSEVSPGKRRSKTPRAPGSARTKTPRAKPSKAKTPRAASPLPLATGLSARPLGREGASLDWQVEALGALSLNESKAPVDSFNPWLYDDDEEPVLLT